MSTQDVSQFLYSTESLKAILSELKKDDRVMERILHKHFKAVLDSRVKSKPIKAFRTFDQMRWKSDNVVPYSALENMQEYYKLALLNPHSGQRKLMIGLFEFILQSLDHLQCNAEDLLVVYAGASGKASAVIAHLFPQIKIILYDPEENTTDLIPSAHRKNCRIFETTPDLSKICWNDPNKNMFVFTKEAGWFTDAIAQSMRTQVLPMSGRKYIAFVSDVRREATEENIVEDMRDQARWTILLQADSYMYKFRVPYDTTLYQKYFDDYLDEALRKKTRNKEKPENNGENIFYLQGKLHIQLFGPPHTIEMRLIGTPDKRGKYLFTNYSAKTLEDKMALFNIAYRSHALLERDGFIGNYDNLFEHLLMIQYLERKGEDTSIRSAQELSFTINKMMLGEKQASESFNPKPFVERNLAKKLKGEPIPPLLQNIMNIEGIKIKTGSRY